MSSLSTLPKGDSAWLLRKSIQRIMQQVSVLETNIGSSTTGNSANTQVIFNDAGTLRGDAGLTYNKTTDTLSTGSATISGDLTVDTSTLKVDSANDRVGLGIAAPAYRLHVQGTASLQLVLQSNDTNANAKEGTVNVRHYTNAEEPVSAVGGFTTSTANEVYLGGGFSAGNAATLLGFYTAANNTTTIGTERYRIASDGVATWSNVGGVAGTAMTLNATGLGVGESPVFGQKLTVNGSGSVRNGNRFYLWDTGNSTAHGIYNSGDNLTFFKNNGTASMTLDASGNLLVGTTNALQLSNNASVTSRIANLGTGSKGAMILRENEASAFWGGNLYLQKVRGTSTAVQSGDALGLVAFGGFDGTNYVNTATIQALVTGAVSAGVVPVKIQVVATSGGVELTNTATSWAAISDERLKDIIEPINNAVVKVGLLRSVIGKYKSDSEGTRRSFLIAQDVQSALPEAVGGNEDSMTVRYTEVIPLLVAAIKELTARVQTLEAK